MRTFSFVVVTLLLLVMASSQPALAGASTFTQTFHNELFPIFDPANPCNPAIGTGIVNGVTHMTIAGNGSIHFTITLTGSFEVIDLNSGQNATGHFTFWAGQNVNLVGQGHVRNSETFTLSVHGELDDGSPVRFNIVAQFRAVDGVPTLFFQKPKCHES